MMSVPQPRLTLPQRDPFGHKGTFGKVAIVGGCARPTSLMVGAPVLAGLGALRAGCGLVRLAMPAPIAAAGLGLLPSATAVSLPCDASGELIGHDAVGVIDELCSWGSALVIGPGFGMSRDSGGIGAATLRAIQQEHCPVVVDADGLNALAEIPDLARELRGQVILTPHAGEFSRLAAPLKIPEAGNTRTSRVSGAEALAQKLGAIVVLKGAESVVTDGQRTWASSQCAPTLAIPGSGDVLSGVIAGLIAQHARHPGTTYSLWDLACIGVEAHALAGQTWAQCHHASGGMLATELCGFIPRAIEELREPEPPAEAKS